MPGAERVFVLICRCLSKKAALATCLVAAGEQVGGIQRTGLRRQVAFSAAAAKNVSLKNPVRDQSGLRGYHSKNQKRDTEEEEFFFFPGVSLVFYLNQ